jgi:rfaE bifunctional protein nucleotidyltransferase chain/domain
MSSPVNSKLFEREALIHWAADQRSIGRRIGFTCGAFDILHVGHVEYLTLARQYCDRLVVAVNTDRSIRSYKNPLRPINVEAHRLAVIAALQVVDAVTLMDELRPATLIELLRPDVYLKGGDYSADQLKSKSLVESYGGRVVCIPIHTRTSTSSILERAAEAQLYAKPPEILTSGRPRLVFLDRDGTLIRDVPFLHDPSRVELMPGVIEGFRELQDAGFKLVMITNQQGIGLGYYDEAAFIAVNRALLRLLAPHGIGISRIYYCPHSEADRCECRKPGTRLIENALQYYGADANQCYFIGDTAADCNAAGRAGCLSVLISDALLDVQCTYRAKNFGDAARWIMTSEASRDEKNAQLALRTNASGAE